jgi:hypothetical protein
MRNLAALVLLFSLNTWAQQPKVAALKPRTGDADQTGIPQSVQREVVVAVYAEDATLVSDGGTFRGRDEIRNWVKSGLDQGSRLEIELIVEKSSGTLAYGMG